MMAGGGSGCGGSGGGGVVLLLGEDGCGYELARRLDGAGTWRAWLGDAAYAAFSQALSSPAAWDSFMSPSSSSSSSTNHLRLQLRARALLFDKASAGLTTTAVATRTKATINPDYLRLHGDDIYYTLEDDLQESNLTKQSQPAFSSNRTIDQFYDHGSSAVSRYNEAGGESISQRQRYEDLPESWYSANADKYKMRRHHSERELHKRTSEGMCSYLRLREIHKRKRRAFQEDLYMGTGQTMRENGPSGLHNIKPDTKILTDEEIYFVPETMFPSNCVPDTALPLPSGVEEMKRVEIIGTLDNLPDVTSPSPAMMERFGLRPEYVKIGSKYRGRDGGNIKLLGEERASKMTNQSVAHLMDRAGFEGGTEVSIEVLSDYLGNHICKLGRTLRILTDSYRKRFSSMEFLKIFMQTAGYSNVASLAEVVKDGCKGSSHQTQQNVRIFQNQNSVIQAQQIQRQMQPQMSMLQAQNLAYHQQQQWAELQRRQPTAPRGSLVMMDKDQAMVNVKTEIISESPMDVSYSTLNKHQLQMRQQQMTIGSHHAQAGQQFKPLPSVQISRLHPQTQYNNMRTQPVKVEGLHELISGDSTLKHESEQSKLNTTQK